jgi:hypothetical protein
VKHRGWGLLLVIPAALWFAGVMTLPFESFHQQLVLSGTPGRFADTVVTAGRADTRAALWLDNLFVVSWLVVVPRLLREGLGRWGHERWRISGWWIAAPQVAFAAGALDLVGNGVSLYLAGKTDPLAALTLLVATLAWPTWVCYVAAGAALTVLVIAPLSAPVFGGIGRRLLAAVDRAVGSASVRWCAGVTAVLLASVVAGQVLATRPFHRWFPHTDVGRSTLLSWRELAPARLVVPAVVLCGVAVWIRLLVGGARANSSERSRRVVTLRWLALAAAAAAASPIALSLVVMAGRRTAGALGSVVTTVLAFVVGAVGVAGMWRGRVGWAWLPVGAVSLLLVDVAARTVGGWVTSPAFVVIAGSVVISVVACAGRARMLRSV